jgi:hypothetical protein
VSGSPATSAVFREFAAWNEGDKAIALETSQEVDLGIQSLGADRAPDRLYSRKPAVESDDTAAPPAFVRGGKPISDVGQSAELIAAANLSRVDKAERKPGDFATEELVPRSEGAYTTVKSR